MERLVQILYLVSNGLLVPVIAGLLGLFAWALLEVGGFVREFLLRRRMRQPWETFLDTLQSDPTSPQRSIVKTFFDRSDYPGFLAVFAEEGRPLLGRSVHLGRLVSQLELEAEAELARMSFGVRVGPILGLMGTLIPLGPALIGLASGDVETLARNLVVAFSTTVLGLCVGGVCYVLSLVRRKWYSQDLTDIDYLYQCLFDDGENDESLAEPEIAPASLAASSAIENAG